MKNILVEAKRLGLLRPLDIQFALMLATPTEPAVMLASAWLSADSGVGHVCLPLRLLTLKHLFNGQKPSLAKQAWLKAGNPSRKDWHQYLLASPAVSDGSHPTPLVLDNQRLYLQRMWRYECIVAEFFNHMQKKRPVNNEEERIADILTHYFPEKEKNIIDWQKISVAMAITHPLALISGGPGTGKTSIIAKLLAVFLKLHNYRDPLRILMAAPTGKAVVRLNESLGLAVQSMGLNKEQKKYLPRKAITLHRLLGAQPNSQKMHYHSKNLIHADIFIVDEASMIDLPTMAHFVAALPSKAKVIFLGDHYQLSSVEAGAIFGDICQFANVDYSLPRRMQLKKITGFTLPKGSNSNSYSIADSLCFLRKNYRFKESSGIARLANAIKVGDERKVFDLLNNSAEMDISYMPLDNWVDYQHLLEGCVNGYRDYLQRVHSQDKPTIILKAFKRFQLLCALREGPFGVAGLNVRIEQALIRAGLLVSDNPYWYIGRPVMIIRNALSLGLYNGEIGIVLRDNKQILRVYFLLQNGEVKRIPLSSLPEHETAFAITVHKSQGSEFQHTALVLPKQSLSILTRELFYTAVTRASKKFSLYANKDIVQYAINTQIYRRSGLIERLTRKVPIETI